MRLLKPSRNSATVPQKFLMMTCRSWRTLLENFVVFMYDRSSAATGVDEAGLDLFARKQRSYDALPPTRAALMEHVKRAAHQSGIIWGQATVPNPETGSPADWDWNQAGEMWQIDWTTLPSVATCCQELTKCSCKMGCTRRCKCFRSGLSCTALCSCCVSSSDKLSLSSQIIS